MELLIRVINRPDPDRKLHCRRFHRGDVIAAKPSDHPWTLRERKNRHWRILNVPSLTQIEADSLLSPELDPMAIKRFTWKRRRKLDLDSPTIPTRIANYLTDNNRSQAKLRILEAGEIALFRSLEIIKEDADT